MLTEIFKMSCREINIRANTNFQTRGQANEGIQASIGASFELKPPQH